MPAVRPVDPQASWPLRFHRNAIKSPGHLFGMEKKPQNNEDQTSGVRSFVSDLLMRRGAVSV